MVLNEKEDSKTKGQFESSDKAQYLFENHLASNSSKYGFLNAEDNKTSVENLIKRGKEMNKIIRSARDGNAKTIVFNVGSTQHPLEYEIFIDDNPDQEVVTKNRLCAYAHRVNVTKGYGFHSSLVACVNFGNLSQMFPDFPSLIGSGFSFQRQFIQDKMLDAKPKINGKDYDRSQVAAMLMVVGSLILDYAAYANTDFWKNKEKEKARFPGNLSEYCQLVIGNRDNLEFRKQCCSALNALRRQHKNILTEFKSYSIKDSVTVTPGTKGLSDLAGFIGSLSDALGSSSSS